MKNPIGANVKYVWSDDEAVWESYISFGHYIEEMEEDSFGVPDEDILYYAEGEADLKTLQTPSAADFVVLTYELVYVEEL